MDYVAPCSRVSAISQASCRARPEEQGVETLFTSPRARAPHQNICVWAECMPVLAHRLAHVAIDLELRISAPGEYVLLGKVVVENLPICKSGQFEASVLLAAFDHNLHSTRHVARHSAMWPGVPVSSRDKVKSIMLARTPLVGTRYTLPLIV